MSLYLLEPRLTKPCGKITRLPATSSLFIIFVKRRIDTAPKSYKGCSIEESVGRVNSVITELLAVMISNSSGTLTPLLTKPFSNPTATSQQLQSHLMPLPAQPISTQQDSYKLSQILDLQRKSNQIQLKPLDSRPNVPYH